jgi:hypothetical protein
VVRDIRKRREPVVTQSPRSLRRSVTTVVPDGEVSNGPLRIAYA